MKDHRTKMIGRWSALVGAVIMVLLSQGCIANRCARPILTGRVYDAATRLPLSDCVIKCNVSPDDEVVKTTSDGYYELTEMRYHGSSRMCEEAPPLSVILTYSKPGYETDHTGLRSHIGGGVGRGTHWKVEPIYLKPKELQDELDGKGK